MATKINASDIVGTYLGNVLVVALVGRFNNHIYYDCKCSCGSEFMATRNKLLKIKNPTTNCTQCARRITKRIRTSKLDLEFKRKPGKTRVNHGESS